MDFKMSLNSILFRVFCVLVLLIVLNENVRCKGVFLEGRGESYVFGVYFVYMEIGILKFFFKE